ncbi:hypothetical protein [Rivularia sp. UHCC 0363]|uniref:hypothetical protein n=1 Tax=Rivularia sp. UHCC 0363 TaxID=3110244 RepID=UPI002B1EF347|nr:hypothetical protein [Rivularia sp. UHCC 0363]MEA5596373.1 hypothetical protein [Rivularia sp. UHCC 0363]
METREKIVIPGLSLTVYREIAAHLGSVEGIEVGFMEQTSQEFDYNQSQVGGLWIDYTSSTQARQWVRQILAYYQHCYGV